jgi:hypothetical protein
LRLDVFQEKVTCPDCRPQDNVQPPTAPDASDDAVRTESAQNAASQENHHNVAHYQKSRAKDVEATLTGQVDVADGQRVTYRRADLLDFPADSDGVARRRAGTR